MTFSKELVTKRNRIERDLVKELEKALESGNTSRVLAAILAFNQYLEIKD